MLPRLRCTVFLILCVAVAAAKADPAASWPASEVRARIRAGIDRLNALYWSPTLGIWLDRPGNDLRAHYEGRLNPPWWPSANAVEVLIDFMGATGASEDEASIESLYELQKNRPLQRTREVAELKARHQWGDADERAWAAAQARPADPGRAEAGYYTDFQNEYLDDSAWWAITWLKMHERTGAAKYLRTAQTIHAHMAKNWNAEKGGGILWCEDADKQQPNAITNNLYVILSARLYQTTHEAAYLDEAMKTLQWIRASSLYDGTAVVDKPGHHGDYWSYNQGTYLGGLTSLYLATGQPEFLDEALAAVDGILHRSGLVFPSGVLIEKLGTKGDAALFKGVLARYLAQLREVLRERHLHPEVAREIDRCLQSSAASLLGQGLSDGGLFTAEWHEGAKDRTANFNTQVSALALLTASLPRGSRP